MKEKEEISYENLTAKAVTISQKLKGGEVIALTGTLGAGKTTFVQKLARHLKVKGAVSSPTFTLMRTYPAKLKSGKKITFYHLDIYRCRNFLEVKQLGIAEIWNKKNAIVAIEWAEKIKRHLPASAIRLKFKNPYVKTKMPKN